MEEYRRMVTTIITNVLDENYESSRAILKILGKEQLGALQVSLSRLLTMVNKEIGERE